MSEKYVLGLHLLHTSTAALLRNSDILAVISEERLNRKKVFSGFPVLAVKKILDLAGVKPEQISLVTIPSTEIDISNKNLHRHIFKHSFAQDYAGIVQAAGYNIRQSCRYVLEQIGIKCEIRFYDHHLSHASSAVYTSLFDDPLIVTADGYGDGICMSVYEESDDGVLSNRDSVDKFYSIGRFYSFVTKALGFEMLRHEGKITGLAAFGDKSVLQDRLKEYLVYDARTNTFSSEMLDRLRSPLRKWTLRVEQRLARHFKPDTVGGWLDYGFVKSIKALLKTHSREDIAAGAQNLLEEVVVPYVTHWLNKLNKRNLVLAGGVFANVRLNQKLLEIDGVENIYIHPGMGDEGLALGSAFLGIQESQKVEKQKLNNVYLGEKFSEQEILNALEQYKAVVNWKKLDPKTLAEQAAKHLVDENIVAIFTSRMEYGPRALGARTIMANPTRNKVNDELNKRLRRTEFMPFAPVVLDQYAKQIFENLDGAEYAAEFMTITSDVKEEWKEKLSAVVHVDGTARPQIIRREENPLYFSIISEFCNLTGIPVVVNTSFNMHEEPIVDCPTNALRALQESAFDYLILENYYVEPKPSTE